MEERRKIIIPTGANPEASASRPYFNTEATRAARPVVPLPEAVAQAHPVGKSGNRRWPLLALLVLAAVGIGVASGLAISGYQRSRQPAETSVAVRPVASKPLSTLPWTHTPEEPVVEEDATAQVTDVDETAAGQVTDETPARVDADKEEKQERKAEREAEKREKREQQLDERADYERDQRRQDRARRRGPSDRNRNDDDLPQDPTIPRLPGERHGIREIFEGIP
jgi:hypothetical protein